MKIIVFVILGFVIGSVANDMAIPIIIGISILWAFVYGTLGNSHFYRINGRLHHVTTKRIVVFYVKIK
jgi:hypothetical protein